MSSLPSVLLFAGPEDGQKAEALAELKERIRKHSGAPADEHRVYLPDQSIVDALDVLSTGSLFGSHRLVLLADAGLIKRKEDIALLKSYLERPAQDATLVLLSSEVKLDRRVEKLVPGSEKTIFWELFDNQKRSWVLGYLRKRNVRIDSDAIDLLLELVSGDTRELRAEADKLSVYAGENGITVEDVETHIYHSKQESVFSLHRRIVEGDLESALLTMQWMAGSGEGEPIAVVGGLLFQIRRILSLRALVDEGVGFQEACGRVGIRGKRIQSDYRTAVERYSRTELERQLQLLIEYDVVFREMGSAVGRLLLDLMLYQLVYRTEALHVGSFADS